MFPELEIIGETNHWIAVNKPAGRPTIPDNPNKKNDVLGALKHHTQQKLFVVHRLDKYVTGVLIFAKTIEFYRCLRNQFSDRSISKTYEALVLGCIQQDNLVIAKPLRRFCSGRVGVDEERGDSALTKIYVQNRYEAHTHVHIHPETGRRHQIRVHLAALGHPIAGDRRYGDKRLSVLFPSILLHSKSLEFMDIDGTKVCLHAHLPQGFQIILKNLEDLHTSGFDWKAQSPLTLSSSGTRIRT